MVVQLWPADAGQSPDPRRGRRSRRPSRSSPARPRPIDPARHGDLGQRLVRQPAVRDADRRRPVARRPTGPRRVVDRRGGRHAGRVHAARRPRVQRRHAASPRTTSSARWRRLFTPGNPSPLASLIADVKGARALLSGASTDPSTLGVRADGDRRVVVDLERGGGRPAGDRLRRPVRDRARGRWTTARSRPTPGKLRRQRRLHARTTSTRTRSSSRPTRATGRASPPSRPSGC